MILFCLGLCLGLPLAAQTSAQNKTSSGEFEVEPATLVSLGFEWKIAGDNNRDARVDVTYRIKGEQQWRKSLPLMRLQREQIGVAPGPGAATAEARYPLFKYTAANMFSGSILNLEPDTEYDCRFNLIDPDGVTGAAEKFVTVHTRKEPQPAAGGNVYHVYPVDWQGPKQQPAFTGLMAAYYMGLAHFDYENAFPPRVQPGDTILVHAGLYVGDRFHYMNGQPRPGYLAMGNLFDGTYYLTQSGTPEKPIVIKGAGDGEVIFDGAGCQTFFNLMGGSYNYFEGITFRNTNVAFLLGIKGIAGSSGFTLKRSKLIDIGRAIQDDWSGSKNFYIADNVFIGRHDPDKMMGWNGAPWTKFPEYPELLKSEYAIKIYGQGHVVAYNYIANWHDGIDVATYGTPDGAPNDVPDRVPLAIDFYNNDIFNMGDNCIETDGGARNVRVFNNRCFNSAAGAISVQPMFGGPVYFFRNLIYNTPTGSLKYIEGSSGILTYNNTIIGEGRAGPASNETFRNNLILAQGAMEPVFAITTYTNYTSSDYNGFRPNAAAADSFEWNTPAFGTAADFEKTPVTRHFKTLKDYSEATGQDKHSVLLDYGIFRNVPMPDITDPQHVYKTDGYDFSLKPGSAAVDAGVELPGITDGFTGRAPDLGAYESGRPLPHYGPR
ncbi:MAG TPA: hypothetical protein VHZ74_00585 [Bryobacteraceae bacterium]|nr:hypothetical protein [Bryobacteraceae bacterium]